MQGIHPQVEDGELTYRIQAGRFLEFCEEARKRDAQTPCVLIIDEINRANLSRVFGELMYLLEYRDKAIPLAVGGEKFNIPANVYLIGTMNTADRSIALCRPCASTTLCVHPPAARLRGVEGPPGRRRSAVGEPHLDA